MKPSPVVMMVEEEVEVEEVEGVREVMAAAGRTYRCHLP
jgi:hypothetical protein